MLHVLRVRGLDGEPVLVERTVYADWISPAVEAIEPDAASVTQRLFEDTGLVFAYGEHVIDAVAAGAQDAEPSRHPPHQPAVARPARHDDPRGTPGRVVGRPLPLGRRELQRAQLDRQQRAGPQDGGVRQLLQLLYEHGELTVSHPPEATEVRDVTGLTDRPGGPGAG